MKKWKGIKMMIDKKIQEVKNTDERFEIRKIDSKEAEQAAKMEQICFPPNEACSKEVMIERATKFPELFLVAEDKENGKLAGLLNGICTDETEFRDEFFKDTSLHHPDGKNVMLVGLEVLPEYRGFGLAKKLMSQYIQMEQKKKKEIVFLTCLPEKIKMYEKMGFCDDGISKSTWGGEQWHQMRYVISPEN